MSNKLDQIKDKVRQSSSSGVHSQLIDTNIIEEDRKANSQGNVNENVNVIERKEPETMPRREKKKKFEDLFKRDTFWVKNELKTQLDEFCRGEKGEKTRVINEALEQYFNKHK